MADMFALLALFALAVLAVIAIPLGIARLIIWSRTRRPRYMTKPTGKAGFQIHRPRDGGGGRAA